MENQIAPASIQVIDGKYCDGAGNEIENKQVLDTLPLEPYVFRGADLGNLDVDLKLIKLGQLDIAMPADTYDYDNHQWETPLGKKIGEVFAEEDAQCRADDAWFFGEIPL